MMQSLPNHIELPSTNDYKIIIVPEDGMAKRIVEVRLHLMEKFSIEKPGTSIPQIILAHFRQVDSMEKRIIDRLRIIAQGRPAVKIELNGFDSFPPHTIFLKIAGSELLTELVKKIRTDTGKLLKPASLTLPGFMSTPHLTIARKLKNEQFENLWQEFQKKQFHGSFVAHRMILVRRRNSDPVYSPIENFVFENLPIEISQGFLF